MNILYTIRSLVIANKTRNILSIATAQNDSTSNVMIVQNTNTAQTATKPYNSHGHSHTNTWLKYTHIPVYIHNNNTVHCTLSKYLQCTQYTCVYNKNIAAAGVVHRVPENTAHVIFTHHLPKLRKNYNFHPQVSGQPVIKYMYNFPHHLTIYYLLYHVIMLGIREQKFSRLTYNYNTFWKCLY